MSTFTESFEYANETDFETVWTNLADSNATMTFSSGVVNYLMSTPTLFVGGMRQDMLTIPLAATWDGNASATNVNFDAPSGGSLDSNSNYFIAAVSSDLLNGFTFQVVYDVTAGVAEVAYTGVLISGGGAVTWTDSSTGHSPGSGSFDLYIIKSGTTVTMGSIQHGVLFTTSWPFTSEVINLPYIGVAAQNQDGITTEYNISVSEITFGYVGSGATYYTPNIVGQFRSNESRFF